MSDNPEWVTVEPDKCDENHHYCVHNWRVHWGNVDRQEGG